MTNKKCPFCGKSVQISDGGYSGKRFLLRCSSWNSTPCPAAGGVVYKTLESALEAWESRYNEIEEVKSDG